MEKPSRTLKDRVGDILLVILVVVLAAIIISFFFGMAS